MTTPAMISAMGPRTMRSSSVRANQRATIASRIAARKLAVSAGSFCVV
jgi:hypothetical protein